MIPEYPGASRFVPASPFNYKACPPGRLINRIVLHITDGSTTAGTVAWFQNALARVSAHFVIGQDGEVVQMVALGLIAWHAGKANGTSIGIEHVANTRGLKPTTVQYAASAKLVLWLCAKYSIPIDRQHILGHCEVDPSTAHKACPDSVWDWPQYMALLAPPAPPAPPPAAVG
jgi:N-acetyl-anhydromuramyl-L-alanine amidase AmpD